MWIHIVIFVIILAASAGWKMGWLPKEGLGDAKARKLVVLVALSGNLLGMFLTMENGRTQVYTQGHRLPKEETGSYEEEFLVLVEGEDAQSMYVQVPEKEGPETAEEAEAREPTEQELRQRELMDAVARYNQEKNDPDYYYLPGQWEGRPLKWESPPDTSGALLSSLCLAAALALLIVKAREEQTLLIKRYEQLLMDYPGLIMKFTLLVQAGMTVRKAFQKIAMDYRKKRTQKERYAYEEVMAACYEMDSGMSEAEAYRRFGERCGQVKYKTFSTLLIQNLQKGSRNLSDMLEKESMEAWDERKRKARVLGEAAATKLLLPMVLMLLVVMAIIMVPACLSFYGS